MAITTASNGLGAAAQLATDVSNVQMLVNNNATPFATDGQAHKLDQLQQSLVSSLLASGRLVASEIITSCGITSSLDEQIAATSALVSTTTLQGQEQAVVLNALQIQAVENAMVAHAHHKKTAATILATMS